MSGLPFRAVHQLVSNFDVGDAIGNHVRALRKLLRTWGYASEVYAQYRHMSLLKDAHFYTTYRAVSSPDTAVLFHFSIGSEVTSFFAGLRDRRAMVYHNITPPEYFVGVNARVADRFTRRTHFRRWHAVSFQQRQEFGRRMRPRKRLDMRTDLVDVCHAGIARREARVVFELRVPDGGEDTSGELFVRRADRHVAVGRLVDAKRRQTRDNAASTLRKSARLEQVEGLGGNERRQDAEH